MNDAELLERARTLLQDGAVHTRGITIYEPSGSTLGQHLAKQREQREPYWATKEGEKAWLRELCCPRCAALSAENAKLLAFVKEAEFLHGRPCEGYNNSCVCTAKMWNARREQLLKELDDEKPD